MAKLRFKSETPLYTSDATPWRLDQAAQVLDRLYALQKPVVIFVHGRGKEPNKSLKGATFTKGLAVAKIELGYDTSVLMFNWDSAFKGIRFRDRSRPLSNVPAAAEALAGLLTELRSYLKANPTQPPPVLLVHSMGSIVIQSAVQAGLWPADRALFKRIIFSQPDADDVGHAAWLDSLARAESVFVTLNRDDWVLRKSTDERPEGAHALGLDTTQPLAQQATYVDLSGMGAVGTTEDDDHEVFGKGAMNGQVFVCQFFEQAICGSDVVLDPTINVETVNREVVFSLRVKFDSQAPCLQVPQLPTKRSRRATGPTITP